MKKDVLSLHNSKELHVERWGGFELAYYSVPYPMADDPNEDSMGFFSRDKDSLIMMVADGAGGHPKGEEASYAVVSSIVESLTGFKLNDRMAGHRDAILDGIELANQHLLDRGSGSKTTVSVAEIVDRRLRAYQVGDSGVVVSGQKGKLKFKSTFHSVAGYGVEAGLLKEEEALNAPHLNEVANIVGDKEMSIEVGSFIELDDRDTVLVASDGVFDNFSIEAITEMIRVGSIEDVGMQIVDFFEMRKESDPEGKKTKYDDMSFMLCRLNSNN